jgi:hypothetical protein
MMHSNTSKRDQQRRNSQDGKPPYFESKAIKAARHDRRAKVEQARFRDLSDFNHYQ